jgi:hypothetical protein
VEVAGIDATVLKYYWCKWIDRVDREKATGFAFVGAFFANETFEIEVVRPRLILLAASSGSDEYYVRGGRRRKAKLKMVYEYHGVFLLGPMGELEPTGLVVEGVDKWGLTIRDQVALWLDRITQVYGEGTVLQVALDHLVDRMLAVRFGTAGAWNGTDCEMIQRLFNALEETRKHANQPSTV